MGSDGLGQPRGQVGSALLQLADGVGQESPISDYADDLERSPKNSRQAESAVDVVTTRVSILIAFDFRVRPLFERRAAKLRVLRYFLRRH